MKRLILERKSWRKMRQAVHRSLPEEGCGLVSGEVRDGSATVHQVFPITNELHSPVRFRLAPYEQLQAFEAIEGSGNDLVGIFHSHPVGPDTPSPTDIAEAYYPEVVHLIWSHRTGRWICRAYRIQDGRVEPVLIESVLHFR